MAYRGLPGAFPYAVRRSDSRLFRAYAVVGGLVAVLVAVVFCIALVVLLGDTAAASGGTFTFVRAFFLVVGLVVVAPVVAPVLLVARRHRRGGSDCRYDAALAVAGFAFLVALYLGLVASVPECFVIDGARECRSPPSGLFAPAVAALYAVPTVASPLLPLAGAAGIAVAHRLASER